MKSQKPHGNVLLIFLVSFSVLIITFVMLTMSQSGTIFANKSWARYYGLRLADSAIYAAIGHLKEGGIEFDDDVKFEVDPEKFGTLTFDSEAGVPYSTNNLVGNTKKTGWNGTAVPPGFCHLVAVGHHHGFEIVREALVKDPPYPYSLASAGRIEGEQLEVFGLPEGQYSALGPDDELVVDEKDKEPSHVVSNSTASGAEKAILLGADTKIAGDIKASGEIDASLAQVQGNVLPNSQEQNLPDIKVTDFDPAGKDAVYDWEADMTDLVGRSRYTGNLNIGDLEMAEGLLYVDGDVTISGTVKGKGAIVATGKITVIGTMDTHSDHAALVAKDDITIHGDGPNSSRFQGLVYSEGSIDIAKTTIMGAAVSRDSVGLTKLEDTTFIKVPELTKMNLDLHLTLEEAKKSASQAHTAGGGQVIEPIGILHNGTFTPLTPNPDNEALQALGALLGTTDRDGDNWDFIIRSNSGDIIVEPPFTDIDRPVKKAWGFWDDYMEEHLNGEPKVERIFNLDLNTLISVDTKLEMMYHTTVNTEDRN